MTDEVGAMVAQEAEARRSGLVFPMSDLERMARAVSVSGLFGAKTPEQALALMLIAQAEGLHPATAAQEYDIIQGRPAMKSVAMLARFQRAGGRVEWLERSDKRCAAKFSHPQSNDIEIEWTFERATKAQVSGKDNYKKHPTQMLASRVVSEGVKACYPACLNLACPYTPEEVVMFDDKPLATVTAPRRSNADVIAEKARTPLQQIETGIDWLGKQYNIDRLRVSAVLAERFGVVKTEELSQEHADYLRGLCQQITDAPATQRMGTAQGLFSNIQTHEDTKTEDDGA